MLRLLSIENFALIKRLEVEFASGLNLITGETGSGKSILVDAVGLLAGRRASSDMIRSGSDRARVTGVFQLPPKHPALERLADSGIEAPEGELIVRREIASGGTNKVYLNGALTTLSQLGGLGTLLADIHGQHDQQQLLQPSAHLAYLDAFAGILPDVGRLSGLAGELSRLAGEIANIRSNEQQRLRQMDLLRYQIDEIEKLKLEPGVDESLEAERRLLTTAEKRFQHAGEAYRRLYDDDDSALALIERASRALEELSLLDSGRRRYSEQLSEARIAIQELAYELRDYRDTIESNPNRLEAVHQRLGEIRAAERKYGEGVDAVLAFQQEAQAELEQLARREASAEELESQRKELAALYLEKASEISRQRRRAASQLQQRVEHELSELAMQQSRFGVRFRPQREEFSEQGSESAEFLLSANPGEDPKPLARIASGGELSRIILALKTILNPEKYAKTLVFDEVDAGIGGRVASVLGEKLAQLARKNQVFCVTHLPQIAAAAARHFHVDKVETGGRTLIRLQALEGPERENELARMLAGKGVTQTTLRQAREMLRRA